MLMESLTDLFYSLYGTEWTPILAAATAVYVSVRDLAKAWRNRKRKGVV